MIAPNLDYARIQKEILKTKELIQRLNLEMEKPQKLRALRLHGTQVTRAYDAMHVYETHLHDQLKKLRYR